MRLSGPKTLLPALAGIGLLVLGYMRFVEPRWIRVRITPITLAAAPQGSGKEGNRKVTLRVVHLTDFHLSPFVPLAYLENAFRQAAARGPDLICITGDFITDHLAAGDAYASALRILSASAPTFACPGNHDGGVWAHARGGYADTDTLRALLARSGIGLLENADTTLIIRGSRVLVAGLGDLWAVRCDPGAIRADMDTSSAIVKILLTHNPDSKTNAKDLEWDLMLAGHTHGGQMKLPFIGTPFAPVRDRDFVNGLRLYQGNPVYVSPGVGNLHGMRLNCRPEISVLDLVRGQCGLGLTSSPQPAQHPAGRGSPTRRNTR